MYLRFLWTCSRRRWRVSVCDKNLKSEVQVYEREDSNDQRKCSREVNGNVVMKRHNVREEKVIDTNSMIVPFGKQQSGCE